MATEYPEQEVSSVEKGEMCDLLQSERKVLLSDPNQRYRHLRSENHMT